MLDLIVSTLAMKSGCVWISTARGRGMSISWIAAMRPGRADMTPMLIKEFLKQFVQCLIAAWIVSMIAASFVMRAGIVTAIGVSAGIATNVSYWNWYGFPLNYTEAQILIEVVSALVAGLAISAVLPRKAV